MSFEIPDIQKVRDDFYKNECKPVDIPEPTPTLETRVNKWIEDINNSIKFNTTNYNGTGWRMNNDVHEIYQHPKFQLYIEKLVQAGYTIKITKPPIILFNIYWDPDMKPELIWYDYYKYLSDHEETNRKLRLNQTLRDVGYFVLFSVLVGLLATIVRF